MSTYSATRRAMEKQAALNPSAADEPSQQMRCMEVWGGSDLTERGVEEAVDADGGR